MQITALSIKDFKRLREIELQLTDADRHWILVAGQNAQGKSSLLDALAAALGGGKKIPADPVRHGASKAEIRVEIDGGALVVRRVIKPDGKTTLEVTHDGLPVRSQQEVLNGLVGQFLDPLAFLARSPADQRAALLTAIDSDGKIAELDRRRTGTYDKRRDIGRDLRKAEGELERLPEVMPTIPVNVDDLTAELTEAMGVGNQLGGLTRELEDARAAYGAARADIARLTAELQAATARLNTANEAGNAAARALKSFPASEVIAARVAAAKEALSTASQHNAKAAAEVAAADRRRRAAEDVELLRKEVDALSLDLEEIDTNKAAILAAAPMPVDGLGVSDDGITLNGVPLEQASSAERVRFALAFAISVGAKLGDVMIRDGALLDDQALEQVRIQAERAGVRVWVERVGTRDPGAIVIHDGGLR